MFKALIGTISVAACYLLVGSSYPIAKEAMNAIPLWTFTCVTFLIGYLALLPVTLLRDKTNWFRIPLKGWGAISLQSLFGAVLYTVFLLYGFASTSAVTASVLSSVAPAAVLALSYLFLKEKLTSSKLLSVVLAIAGVVVMTLPSSGGGHTSTSGFLFLSLSTLSTAICIVAAKRLSQTLPPMTLAAGVCLTGTLFTLPMALSELGQVHLGTLHDNVGVLIYYGIFVWALPYICFFFGIDKVRASVAGMCVALIPVASSMTAVMFYGESLSGLDIAAMLAIMLSIVLSEVDISGRMKRSRRSGSASVAG